MTIYTNDSGKKPNPNYIPPASIKSYSEIKWISVKDRFPEDGELVVTYSKKTERIGSSDCLKLYIEEYGNYCEITHWLPLPELPTNK